MSAALALGAIGGGLIGLAYFGSLWLGVMAFAAGRPVGALALQLARFAGLACALAALAVHGAGALLSGAMAMLVMRQALLRRLGREP